MTTSGERAPAGPSAPDAVASHLPGGPPMTCHPLWRVGACALMLLAFCCAGCHAVQVPPDSHAEWEGFNPPTTTSAAPAANVEDGPGAQVGREGEWSGRDDWWQAGGETRPPTDEPPHEFEEWAGRADWWNEPRVVAPRPTEAVVRVEFTGNEQVTVGVLTVVASSQLRLLEESGGDPTAADDAAWAMATEYRRRGFHFARVTYELRDEVGDPQRKRCTFVAEEGARVRLTDVQFRGVSRFDPDELREQIIPARGLLRINQTWFVEAELDELVRKLTQRYVDAGYPECHVEQPAVVFGHSETAAEDRVSAAPGATAGESALSVGASGPDEAVITIVVNEGPFLRVDHIDLQATDAHHREEIRELLSPFVGKPWRRADHAVIAATVREFWQELGFYDASVSVEARRTERTGSVSLVVGGDPRGVWHVGSVSIDTDSLAEGFVRSIIPLKSEAEQQFSLSREREAYRQLLRTGLVERVTFEREADPDTRIINYTLRVREVRSVIVRPHLGWGSYEGPRGWLQVAETNLFGAAREISLTGGISLRSHWGEVKFSDAWTLGGEFPFSLSFFYRRRDEPDFKRQDFGGRLLVSHQFSPEFDASLFYELRDTRAFDITDPDSTSAETAQLGSLGLRLRWSDAEPLVVPRHGMRHSLQIEHYNQLLGANLDFTRVRLDSALYLPIDVEQRVVLAFGYLMELFIEHGDTDGIPIQERVFNGGATSVRSFGEQEMRAWEFPDSTRGGQMRQVASIELRFPLLWDFGLDGAVFIDAGNLAPQLDSAFDHFRIGIGVGLRYMTPIGPARIDVAWNTYPRNEEDRWLVHFWIGFPF